MIKDKNKGSVHFWQLLPSQGLGLQWVIKVRDVLAIVPSMECAMQCSMMYNDVQARSTPTMDDVRYLSMERNSLCISCQNGSFAMRSSHGQKGRQIIAKRLPLFCISLCIGKMEIEAEHGEREDSGQVITKKCALCIFSGFRKNGDWNVAWIERKI